MGIFGNIFGKKENPFISKEFLDLFVNHLLVFKMANSTLEGTFGEDKKDNYNHERRRKIFACFSFGVLNCLGENANLTPEQIIKFFASNVEQGGLCFKTGVTHEDLEIEQKFADSTLSWFRNNWHENKDAQEIIKIATEATHNNLHNVSVTGNNDALYKVLNNESYSI